MSTEEHNLQTLWHSHFPLSKAMGLSVISFQEHVLTTMSPLAANTNIHDTAFAGSLYAQQAMTAWGLLYLEIARAGLDASLIHADGEIKFHKTLTSDIYATSDFNGLEAHLDELAEKGKTRLTLEAQAGSGEPGSDPASTFVGTYVARLAQ